MFTVGQRRNCWCWFTLYDIEQTDDRLMHFVAHQQRERIGVAPMTRLKDRLDFEEGGAHPLRKSVQLKVAVAGAQIPELREQLE
jgi:hypothetical protein